MKAVGGIVEKVWGGVGGAILSAGWGTRFTSSMMPIVNTVSASRLPCWRLYTWRQVAEKTKRKGNDEEHTEPFCYIR